MEHASGPRKYCQNAPMEMARSSGEGSKPIIVHFAGPVAGVLNSRFKGTVSGPVSRCAMGDVCLSSGSALETFQPVRLRKPGISGRVLHMDLGKQIRGICGFAVALEEPAEPRSDRVVGADSSIHCVSRCGGQAPSRAELCG